MLSLIILAAAPAVILCGLLAGMAALLLGAALYTDWRDGVRA
ncbi:hypothetical protein OH783_01640 [Kocuria rhizophila]|nr:hypothetical protein OH783_01640 [Kocuria rhizophila]WSZ54139.1 hypothetical protein OG926_01640 [Kocuria rhizophila]